MACVKYYNYQVGGGGFGVRNVFIGSRFQRGHGIGSFLGGLMRTVLPYLKSGARFLGKEAFKAGINIIDDVENKGVGFREAVNTHSKESFKNIKRRASKTVGDYMNGDGYKRSNKKRKSQSVKVRSKKSKKVLKRLNNKKKKNIKKKNTKKKTKNKKKTNKKQKVRNITDIFGSR